MSRHLSALLLAALGCEAPAPTSAPPRSTLRGEVSLSGAWALYPLAVRWADAFGRLHPGVHVHVSAGGSGKGAVDALDGFVDLGMLSRPLTGEERARGAWALPVARDAVVLVASDQNPALTELRRRGLSPRELRTLFGGELPDPRWDLLAPETGAGPLRCYARSDAGGTSAVLGAWLGLDPTALAGIGIFGDPGVAEVVRRDPAGLGYCNASLAYDPVGGRPVQGLAVLPLDQDDDDAIGPDEATCADLEALDAGVREGRYPAPLVRDLHLVSRGEPSDPLLRELLRWVLAEGQAELQPAGYLPLPEEELGAARAAMGR